MSYFLAGITVLAVTTICFSALWWAPPLYARAVDLVVAGNPVVALVCDLLTKAPEWRVDDYWARHPAGVEIWIGSGLYYIRLNVDGQKINLTSADQNRIWRAFKHRGGGEALATTLAERIIDRYRDDKVVPLTPNASRSNAA